MEYVSLVLATIHRTTEIERLLESLRMQSNNRFELIVVDQNQDERLANLLHKGRSDGISIQHLRVVEPGLSNARNHGIRHASGTIIAFPDDDCWYEPDVISTVLHTMERERDLDGLVACWVEQAQGTHEKPKHADLSLAAGLRFRDGHASSISLFFRRSLYDRLNGYDDYLGLGRWYGAGEETDFVLRALAQGARIAHRPAVRVHHRWPNHPSTGVRTAFKVARTRARGTGAIYAKHRCGSWVIFRGVVAPLIKPVIHRQGLRGIAQGVGMFLGRVEGFVKWRKERG